MANEVQINLTTVNSISSLRSTSNHKLTDRSNVVKIETWPLKKEYLSFYINQFESLQPQYDKIITGSKAKLYFKKSGLTTQELAKIWHLSDQTKDGALSLVEFIIAMHLIVIRKNGYDIPDKLPSNLLTSNIQKLISEHSVEPKQDIGIKEAIVYNKNIIESKDVNHNFTQDESLVISILNKKSNLVSSSIRRSKTLPLNSLNIRPVTTILKLDENNIKPDEVSHSLTNQFMASYKIVEKKQLHSCPDTFVSQHFKDEGEEKCDKNMFLKKGDDISTTLHFNCFVPTIPNNNELNECTTNTSTPPNANDKENDEMSEELNELTPANFDFLPVITNQANGLLLIHHPVAVKSSLDDHVPLVPPYASDDEDSDYLPANGDEQTEDGDLGGEDPSATSEEVVKTQALIRKETQCTDEGFQSQGGSGSINSSTAIKPLPPPFPLPRSKHGRSSSLDLNKLFAKTKDETKTSLSLLPPVIPPRLASPNPQLKKKVEFCVASAITKPNAQTNENGQNLNLDLFQVPNLSDEAKLLIHQRTCSLDRKLPPSFAMFEELETKSDLGNSDPKSIQPSGFKLIKGGLSGTDLANLSKQNSLELTSEDLEDIISRHKTHNYLLMRLNARLNHEKWKLSKRKIMLEEKLKSYLDL